MYNQENQDDKRRTDERLALSVPHGNTIQDRSYIKPIKLSHPYSDECLETNMKSSDNSDQPPSQSTPVSTLHSSRFFQIILKFHESQSLSRD